MAEHVSDLLQNIDTLWFHQSIFHTQPTSNTRKPPQPISETAPNQPFLLLPAPLSEEKHLAHTDPDPVHPKVDDEQQRRPAQEEGFHVQEPVKDKTGSWSSSSVDARSLRRNSSSISRREGKFRNCKSLSQLEYYELKGFMDLGFTFNKDELNPHMLSMIPGLQRLGEEESAAPQVEGKVRRELEKEEEEEEEEEGRSSTMRPYLSEAWLIKRPDSPLLNLRFPSVSVAGSGDMKKHLKFWARTVASEIHLES